MSDAEEEVQKVIDEIHAKGGHLTRESAQEYIARLRALDPKEAEKAADALARSMGVPQKNLDIVNSFMDSLHEAIMYIAKQGMAGEPILVGIPDNDMQHAILQYINTDPDLGDLLNGMNAEELTKTLFILGYNVGAFFTLNQTV